MELTVSQVYEMQEALAALAGLSVPIPAAVKLARLAKVVNGEVETLDTQRLHIIKKHGGVPVPESQPPSYQIKPENLAAFQEDLRAFNETEIEVDLQPIILADLGSGAVPWGRLAALAPVISDLTL